MTRDDGYTRYTVRIPTPLYERVKGAAGEASVNSLLVQLLEEKYPAPEPSDLMLMLEAAREMGAIAAELAAQGISDIEREAARVRLDALRAKLEGTAKSGGVQFWMGGANPQRP